VFAQDPAAVAPDIPPPEALEEQNAVIGSIAIEPRNIFDLDNPDENKTLYRWANALHIVTKPHVIRDQLLFAEGDRYSLRVLDETERLLRQNDYLREVQIEPVSFENGIVDLKVATSDVWTLTPSITAGREGGENRLGIGIKEQNLFGNGMLLHVKYKTTVDRDTVTLDFADPNLRGSRNNLAFRIGSNSDGYDHRFYLARPFYSLDSRRSGGVALVAAELIDPLYDRGEIVSDFQHTLQHHDLFTGRSNGLSNGWVRRFFAGAVYDDHEFAPTPNTLDPISLVPEDRKYVYPYFGFETIEDHFEEAENFDRIGRVEDRFLGTRFAFRLGYAPTAFGSSTDSWHYTASFSNAIVTTRKTSFTVATGLNGRYEDGEARNFLLSIETRLHRRLTEGQLFYASLTASDSSNLDLDNQLLLGGDSGLRGYPLRYQGGEAKALLTLEHRIFTDWYPWRFFNVGAAIFFDAGRTWGENPVGQPNLGLLRDLGIGLRLGSNRLGEGGVLHIDFAFPLDGEETIDNFQILVDARSSF
jgi:hemolysin activation/secretion protein